MSTNINYNQVNGVIENELKFDSSNSLANNPVKYPLPIVNLILRDGKKSRQNLKSGLTRLWDSGATNSMINCKHINPYRSKRRGKKVKYSTVDGPYTTIHDVKVPFSMTDFSIRKFITHYFHIDKTLGDERIGYDMIIFRDLTV